MLNLLSCWSLGLLFIQELLIPANAGLESCLDGKNTLKPRGWTTMSGFVSKSLVKSGFGSGSVAADDMTAQTEIVGPPPRQNSKENSKEAEGRKPERDEDRGKTSLGMI